MVESEPRDRAPVRHVLTGAALFLIGAITIAALIFINNSQDARAVQAMMDLGLAGTALVSATAQLLVFLGGWMVWRATRRRRR